LSTATLLHWVATCPEETKGVLVDELTALGAVNLVPAYRAVAFHADLATGYRAHLVLRTASRIQRVVATFPARTLDDILVATRAVAWPAFVRAHRPFMVAPILADLPARALTEDAVARTVADALLLSFHDAGAPAPRENAEAEEPVTVVAHLRDGAVTLALDTAGRALHKRGWRVPGHPAVLKETLAAAVLLMAGYDGTQTLLDPMCGSGTLSIEAAYIALNKGPLIHRKKDGFGLEHHAGFDRAVWRRVSDEVRAAKRESLPAPIHTSDLREAYVEVARQSALRARVEKHLAFSTRPFETLQPPTPRGLVVANVPYGERIGRGQQTQMYQMVAQVLRTRFAGWRSALLVPAEVPRGPLSMPGTRELPLMNGALPVRLLLTDH
jgi:23S rRNA G2445 N2-methylase RlmL